ncbi:MAG: hypothetical protein FIB00_12740 [Chloroflexi bacterium]|nr:hypothetical protein [Chloroflexota bacterium]
MTGTRQAETLRKPVRTREAESVPAGVPPDTFASLQRGSNVPAVAQRLAGQPGENAHQRIHSDNAVSGADAAAVLAKKRASAETFTRRHVQPVILGLATGEDVPRQVGLNDDGGRESLAVP